LLAQGYAQTSKYPYAYACFDNGRPITPEIRRLYFDELQEDAESIQTPFENYRYFKNKVTPKFTSRMIQRLRGLYNNYRDQ